ncbi:MAG: hypothetical protein ACJ79Q_00170 [Gemmatimonadaceae bacterium]
MKASFSLVALTAAVLSLGCASKPPEPVEPVVARPLDRLAGTEIVVFPVQYLSWTDSLGWQAQIPNRAEFLATLDDQIQAALTARGLGQTWTFGREIGRASKINSMNMRDAYHLSAEWLRARVIDETVRDPLASQVRGLVGLKGQRYAILPVELRLENRAGMGVATLRVVMIDSRMALIKWRGEVSSDPMKTVSPALTQSLATHFADLVVAP